MANIRIKDQTTDTALAAGDYVIVDNATEGTRKFDLGQKLVDIDDDYADVKQDLAHITSSAVPTTVRQAIKTLFETGAYADTGLTDEMAVISSWASQVTAITLNQTSISINGSATSQLVATTTPAGGAVTWSSSDTSVATVSSNGLVTGVGNGTATITATSGDVSATCTATVSGFATLTSISAVYTQSGTVYDTDTLDSLKDDLVVTAHYDDTTTATVPSADYTLSGTLEVGTSTIVVSYGGKTTTFTVVVTQVEWGEYTWLYKASDGQLLSARTDLVTASIGTGCSETLENGLLKLFVPKRTSNFIRFELVQNTNTKGKLTAKVKFNSVGYAQAGTGFRLQISNGTNGAQIFEHWDGSSTYTFGVYEGTTYSDKIEFDIDRWYIISVERTNTGQVVSVDGTPILESSNMSTNYCSKNAIFVQNATSAEHADDSDADIAWITYKNND